MCFLVGTVVDPLDTPPPFLLPPLGSVLTAAAIVLLAPAVPCSAHSAQMDGRQSDKHM